MRTSIRGLESWDSKPRDPGSDKRPGAGFRCDGEQGDSLRPPGGSVNHGEDITETLAGRKRTNQIQANMRKPSPRNWRTHMSLDFVLLVVDT